MEEETEAQGISVTLPGCPTCSEGTVGTKAWLPAGRPSDPGAMSFRAAGRRPGGGMSGFGDEHSGAEGQPATFTLSTELPGPSTNKGLPSG